MAQQCDAHIFLKRVKQLPLDRTIRDRGHRSCLVLSRLALRNLVLRQVSKKDRKYSTRHASLHQTTHLLRQLLERPMAPIFRAQMC